MTPPAPAALARRTVRGSTALSGGRFWRPTPFFVFGGLCWLGLTLAYWRTPMCCGVGPQAAAVERLTASLLHPRHPVLDLPGAGSPAYSPYAVGLGALARASGLAGWEMMRVAGPLALLTLLTGLNAFVRTLTSRQWAPVLALFVLPLFATVADLGAPSTCAAGLALWAWAWADRLPADGAWWRYAGLGALVGVTGLTDPLTGLAAVAGVAVAALTQGAGRPGPPARSRWLTALLSAVAAVVIWPYYATPVPLPTGPAPYVWPVVVGLPPLYARFRRDRRDPLALLCLACAPLLAHGLVTGDHTGLALAPLPLAAAIALAAPRPWDRRRRLLGGAAALAAVAGLVTAQAGPATQDRDSYGWAARHVPSGDVVLTDSPRAARTLPGYGPDLVVPAGPDPVLSAAGYARRRAAVRAYLAPGTSRARRQTVARRYRVRWLLLSKDERLPPEAVLVAWSPRTGEALARVGGGPPATG